MQRTFDGLVKIVLCLVIFGFFLQTVPAIKKISAYAGDYLSQNTQAAVIGETAIVIKVVKEKKDLRIGLSEHESLGEKEGMLFQFQKDAHHGIWMKDMNFPIDIIWINKYAEVVDYEKNVHPNTYPEVFKPRLESRYVLEVKSGFVDKQNIKIGDKFTKI